MALDISCPLCGETEDLSGVPTGELIRITCGSCSSEWDRGPTPRCPTCGTDEVRPAVQAMVEKSRGTQLSIQTLIVIHLCPTCDPARLADYNLTNAPIPPAELPTESEFGD